MSFFSWLWVSGMTMTVRNPMAAPISARPMPVLPAVPSTTVPPGRSAPRATASRMIQSAARSLTDWPGFMNSALPRISQPVASEARRSRISGVRPTAAGRSAATIIASSTPPRASGVAASAIASIRFDVQLGPASRAA